MTQPASAQTETGTEKEAKVPAYSWYALSVLVVLYVLNFIDRNIISILAEDIKAGRVSDVGSLATEVDRINDAAEEIYQTARRTPTAGASQ